MRDPAHSRDSRDHRRRHLAGRPARAAACLLAFAFLAAACGDDTGGSATTTTYVPDIEAADDTWIDWNNAAAVRGYTDEANAVAAGVAADIAAAGVKCEKFLPTDFAIIATSYYRAGIPIPIGSGECDGPGDGDEAENILIEVMGTTAPTGTDLVAFERDLLCAQALDAGRLPDGTQNFPGIPYVIAPDDTWVIRPDTFETNQLIADALGRESLDMCEGME